MQNWRNIISSWTYYIIILWNYFLKKVEEFCDGLDELQKYNLLHAFKGMLWFTGETNLCYWFSIENIYLFFGSSYVKKTSLSCCPILKSWSNPWYSFLPLNISPHFCFFLILSYECEQVHRFLFQFDL